MNRILVLTLAFVLALTTGASAEPVEVTAQAKAANAEFLLRATPPSTPAAICLVDTGVNANPDTSGVIARLSLYGLDGADASPSLHGTQMAMLIGAPSNGFGMVGLWPAARIVSVQANQPGQDVFAVDGYIGAVDRCVTQASQHQTKVILVAAASETPVSADDQAALSEVIGKARNRDLNVVAAAGNFGGRPVGTPANTAGVLSVGAACPTSAAGAALLAPGCGIDGADPTNGQPSANQQGTSAAAAIVATALAALRTWRPDLSAATAEHVIRANASPSGLDVAAAFRAAGLPDVVQPPVPPAAPPPPAPPGPHGKPHLPMPKFSVRYKRRVLTIRAANRPARTRMVVRVYRRDSNGRLRSSARREQASATARLRVSRWSRVTVQYRDPSGASVASELAVHTRAK